MSALYVFALTGQTAPPLRHAERRVEFVEIAGVHAAVERVARQPVVSEAALRAQHEIVMKIADRVDAILPVRFGALMESGELETLVSMRLTPIRKALELVAGRVQMTVRVFGSEAAETRTQPATRDPGSGTAYLEQRRRDTGSIPTGEAAALSRALREVVADERTQRGQGRVLWTIYHLVDRAALPRYKRAIEPFESATVAISGPWPPFAFVPDLWS
jgi:Gas vesicle synthesis protein GvpL/GvpF